MVVLFTICGRSGSKGFKNKNLKQLRGIPLVFYSLAVIKRYIDRHPGDKVVVAINTDSEPLAALVRNQRIVPISFIKRKPELAGDVVAKVEVIKDTYCFFNDFVFDIVIDLDITSPIRRVVDIENAITEFNKGIYDLVFSVVEARRSPYFNMVEQKKDGFYRKISFSEFTARQQTPRSYEMNASIYVYAPAFLEKNDIKTILDYNCGISIMKDYLVLDIDSEYDFEMLQYLYEYYINNDFELEEIYENARLIMKSQYGVENEVVK